MQPQSETDFQLACFLIIFKKAQDAWDFYRKFASRKNLKATFIHLK